ncbi:MAG: hypothetical protein AAB432_01605 [Patescibacteria group bacterium]
MELKYRRVIIVFFTLIFLLVGAYLLLVAAGWVFNFKDLKIIKTGGLFLKFEPSDATLTINGEAYNSKSGLLQSGVLINGLLPADYEIKLIKHGFTSWQKKLKTESGKVTSVTKIRLWPLHSTSSTLEKNLEDFWLTNAGVVTKNKSSGLVFKNNTLRGNKVVLSGPQSDFIVTSVQNNLFLTDLQNPESAINLNNLFQSLKSRELKLPGLAPIKEVFFHPFTPSKLLLLTSNSLYSLGTKKMELERLITATSVNAFALSGNEAFILDGKNNVHIFNLILKNDDLVVNEFPTSTITLKTSANGKLIFFLDKNKQLFAFNRLTKKLEKLSEYVDDFAPEPKNDILALINPKNISLIYLLGYNDDFNLSSGATTTLPFKNLISLHDFNWLSDNPDYFLVGNGNDLILSETDYRSNLNYFTLASDVKKYAVGDNFLYILKTNGELVKSAILR